MKILIFSDSHGDSSTMLSLIPTECPDTIIFLGDGLADTDAVQQQYPSIPMIKLPGNVDIPQENAEWVKCEEIGGKRFMLTHGHTFFTERDFTPNGMSEARQSILAFMFENDIDIVLHGHIHEPFLHYNCLSKAKCGWIMCPGRIGRISNGNSAIKPIYGVLEISDTGALAWQLIEVE